jgi:predicted GNAT family acetyltransferase
MINICPDTGLAYAGNPTTGQRYFIFDHCPGTSIPSECEGWHPDHPVVYTEILEVYMNLARVIPDCPYFDEIKANTTNVTALTSIQIYMKKANNV